MSIFPELRFIPYDYLKTFTSAVRPVRERYYSKRSLIYLLGKSLSKEEVRFILNGFNSGLTALNLSTRFLLRFGANSTIISSSISREIAERTLMSNIIGDKFSTKQEFWFLSSRADLAVFDGNSIGIEIKSEKDNFSRLERQLKDYNRFFKYVYVVIFDEKIDDLNAFLDGIESRPGIITYWRGNEGLSFREHAIPRACKTDIQSKLNELTVPEIISLIRQYDPSRKGLSRLKKSDLLSTINQIDTMNLESSIDHKFMERYIIL